MGTGSQNEFAQMLKWRFVCDSDFRQHNTGAECLLYGDVSWRIHLALVLTNRRLWVAGIKGAWVLRMISCKLGSVKLFLYQEYCQRIPELASPTEFDPGGYAQGNV